MVSRRPKSERVALALNPMDEAAEIATLQALKTEDADYSFTNVEIGTILDQTRSNRVRNAAALVLADRHAAGLAEHLTTLLASPTIAKASGTLLFALDQIGGTLPVQAFLNLIENGSYEARAEALEFLAEDRLSVAASDDRQDFVAKLFTLTQSDDADAVEAASEALYRWRPHASDIAP